MTAISNSPVILLLVSAVLCIAPAQVSAQTSPSWGHIGPSNGEIAAIGIGAIAAIGVVVYLVIPKHPTIEGCVESVEGTSRITAADHKTYVLVPGDVTVANGRRLKVKGKKHKDEAGNRQFTVNKLVEDKGPCSAQAVP
ncbi:MAG TPA: hypothetical protein VKQ11_12340 [Candidatus Sulfotelmatobacter sp.]|nr:hypothetical protein [Candidatus Sulfotelmatobacter sp.]